jgi:hypothetical protein
VPRPVGRPAPLGDLPPRPGGAVTPPATAEAELRPRHEVPTSRWPSGRTTMRSLTDDERSAIELAYLGGHTYRRSPRCSPA